MNELSVEVEVPEGYENAAVLKVSGEVTIGNYRDLLLPFESAEMEKVKWWVLDMTECQFLSSAGLSAILRGVNRAKQRGGALALAEMSARLQSMLKLAGLAKVIAQFDSVEDALRSFGEGKQT